ncbi:MAG TPA: hypothetical protein VL095_17280 [Flavisolibacter sp.]|nr:hypothetical protein [Flavisolibacter sp.]
MSTACRGNRENVQWAMFNSQVEGGLNGVVNVAQWRIELQKVQECDARGDK